MVKYYERGNRRLAFTDEGTGDVIVLLHGYLESLEIFEGLRRRLSSHFRIIAIDLPGHGKSDVISDCHPMELLADEIKSVIDYANAGKVLISGHSLGGYVALAYLERYPADVAGYCLFHSHPFADTEAAVERRNREIDVVKAGKKAIMYPSNIVRMFSPHNLELMKRELEISDRIAAGTTDEGIIAVLRGMIARPSRVKLVEKGEVPLLWILGVHDQYIDYKTVAGSVKLPSNARIATLFDSGHLGFIEEPGRSAALLKEFALSVFGHDSRA